MTDAYHVFLSHNPADANAVEAVARRLLDEAGLRPFLDKWDLVPSEPWMPAIERALESSTAIAVFVGPSGMSPWQEQESQVAIVLATEKNRRLVVVLLPGARTDGVGRFLRSKPWVDLSRGDGFEELVARVTGSPLALPESLEAGTDSRPTDTLREPRTEAPSSKTATESGTPKHAAHRRDRTEYRLSILHVSDLHARSANVDELPEAVREERRRQVHREAASRARVLGDAWNDNLRELYEDGTRPDLVCFTGDVADWGLAAEYAKATEFVDNLVGLLGLERSRIYVVPGNHDVQRYTAEDEWQQFRELARSDTHATSEWLAGGKPPRAVVPAWADAVMLRTASFWRWVEHGLGRPELLPRRHPHRRLGYHDVPSMPDLPFAVHVIGLDSAWLSGNDHDQGKLWLTKHQRDMLLHDVEGRPWSGFRLALVHHPLEELAQPDIGPSRQALAGSVDLLLHGHQHDPVGNRSIDLDGSALRVLAAGCLYEGTEGSEWKNGCQRIDVTLDGSGRPLRAEIYFRAWSGRAHWHTDSSLYRSLSNGRMTWHAWGGEQHATRDPEPPRRTRSSSTAPSGTTPEQSPSSAIAAKLQSTYARRRELVIAGEDTTSIDRTILQLRREQRHGPTLQPDEYLREGRFLLKEVIGRGGFATVWKAYDEEERAWVAIKVLHGHFTDEPSRRERLFRGAKRMAKLQHPNVVRVLVPKAEDQGFYYYAMEYIQGGDLRQAVLERRLTTDQAFDIIEAIAAALGEAHKRGLVHRDVKPENILLRTDGTPALTDFDLVHARDTTGGTRTGALGTVVYAAPEQNMDAKSVDSRADVFGLGMTAIFCVHGGDLTTHVIYQRDAFLSKLRCTAGVRSVLQKAAAIEPNERFESMASFQEAFAAARQGLTHDVVDTDQDLVHATSVEQVLLLVNIGENDHRFVSVEDARSHGGVSATATVIETPRRILDLKLAGTREWRALAHDLDTLIDRAEAAARDATGPVCFVIAGAAPLPVFLYLGYHSKRLAGQILVINSNDATKRWDRIGPFGGSRDFPPSRREMFTLELPTRIRDESDKVALFVASSVEYKCSPESLAPVTTEEGSRLSGIYRVTWSVDPKAGPTGNLGAADLRALMDRVSKALSAAQDDCPKSADLVLAYGGPTWIAFWLGCMLNARVSGCIDFPNFVMGVGYVRALASQMWRQRWVVGQPKVLVLTAEPDDESRTRAGAQLTAIDQAIAAVRGSEHSRHVRTIESTKVSKLFRIFLDEPRPDILHVYAHGGADGTLGFEDDQGNSKPISSERFLAVLRAARLRPSLIVLCAYHSASLAPSLLELSECVVNVKGTVPYPQATAFLGAFYYALARGRTVAEAFELGVAHVGLVIHPTTQPFELLSRDGIDPARMFFWWPPSLGSIPPVEQLHPYLHPSKEEGTTMSTIPETFQSFLSSLELTPKQREDASNQHIYLRTQLQQRMSVQDNFLSGSYARNTAIRPLNDIDVFLVLQPKPGYANAHPITVLNDVKGVLERIYPGKTALSQNRSVNIEFSVTGIAYDVVPAFVDTPGVYIVPNRDTGTWIRTNPKIHADRSTLANEQASKKLKPLLKAVKHANVMHGRLARSFHLEVLSWTILTGDPGSYLDGLVALLHGLADRICDPCPDPAGLGPDIRPSLEKCYAARVKLNELATLATQARAFESLGKPVEAHAKLRAIFGDQWR